jgi:hypothetical protein
MIKSDRKLAELSKILLNGKYNEINARISILRREEPFEGAIRLLAGFYDETGDESLKLVISSFLNDIKERSCQAEVIEALTSVVKPASKTMIASSCWQSGLDYSQYAVALADVFMKGDYLTSLECFTVLDTWAGDVSDRDRADIIFRLQNGQAKYDPAKQKLAVELITVLKG